MTWNKFFHLKNALPEEQKLTPILLQGSKEIGNLSTKILFISLLYFKSKIFRP